MDRRTEPGRGFLRQLSLLTCLAVAASAAAEPIRADTARIEGVWKTPLLDLDDPEWHIEEIACSRITCSEKAFDYLTALVRNPANDDRAVRDLVEEMGAYEKYLTEKMLTPLGLQKVQAFKPEQEGALDCTPDGDGLRHQITAPPPTQFVVKEDRVVIRYEYWNAERTVYLDGRAPPPDLEPTRLGFSTGRFEDGDLIVETTHMIPNHVSVPAGMGALTPSEDAKFIEEYTVADKGERLILKLHIVDPAHFAEPYVIKRVYLRAPDWELDEFKCEAITGEY